jgi:hypothetical protein
VDSFWVIFLVFFGVLMAISLGIGYLIAVRLIGREAAQRNLRQVIPCFLIGIALAFIISLFGKYAWLMYHLLFAAGSCIYLLTWYWRKRQAGSLLLQLGRLSANKFMFWIGVFEAVIAILQSALFIAQVSDGFSSYDSLVSSLAQVVIYWTMAIVFISFGLSRLELRENGICYTFLLTRWERITSYAWEKSKNSTLTIRFKPRFPFFLGFGSIPIPSAHKDAVDRILAQHVTKYAEKANDSV